LEANSNFDERAQLAETDQDNFISELQSWKVKDKSLEKNYSILERSEVRMAADLNELE